MSKINLKELDRLRNLYYEKGLSAREIADDYNVGIDAVYYFMRRYEISRRSASQNNALLFSRKAPAFSIKKNLTNYEKSLKLAGVMLYWAEGANWKGEHKVDFTNSNPDMIRIFLQFLRKVCRINERKLRIFLYCYANQEPLQLMSHWSKVTNIPKKQFTKPYVRKDFSPQKLNKMKHGLVHIRYSDKKLLQLIQKWREEAIRDFLGGYRSG